MAFIPHSEQEIALMLDDIGVQSCLDLFDEIPSQYQVQSLSEIPEALDEQALIRLMNQRQSPDQTGRCFLGAGAYDHFIPTAVWELACRGEFYTAYTPYQAEASQGSLQVIYEYQTLMTELMSMQVSNASLYDGSTALAEAILMAVRIQRGKKQRILVPKNIHPHYRDVLETLTKHQGIELIDIPYHPNTGTLSLEQLDDTLNDKTAAIIISQPNFFGTLEAVDELTDLAHHYNALVIAQVNPLAMAWLKPPGTWGKKGVDIACGEGQPLGVPLSLGGPYYGFMCTQNQYVRQMPGRIVGKTIDQHQRPCFTLTLQTREQHIRRSKATSNICTNQGLVVTASTIYMRLMGAAGLLQSAQICHHRAKQLYQKLISLKDIDGVFETAFFNEFVIYSQRHTSQFILNSLKKHGIQGGYDLTQNFPELGQAILVCATETKTESDIALYQHCLFKELA